MSVRRGLGRGLGALIPTAPIPTQPSEETDAPTHDGHRPDAGPDAATDATTGTGADAVGTGAATPGWHADRAPAAVDEVDGVEDTEDEAVHEVPGATYAEIPVDAIVPNPRQPRQVFDEEALAELVHSIREIGLLQPVVVRPAEAGGYELVAGERRWRATQQAGLDTIPAIVRRTTDDALLRDALLENLHRAQLNPLEEAAAYSQLLQDFGCTQEELSQRLGRSRPQVANTLRLLRLPTDVQRRVAAGVLSAGHARALLALDDEEAMTRLAGRVVAEGLSVRAVEEIVMVGDGDGRPRNRTPRPRGPRAVDPDLVALAERLADRLDTRVRIEPGASRGRVVIDFADVDDLRRIMGLVDPDLS
ncbi:MAG: ParB/RepB/Spo0J family partition protein [Candidatus Nanopelagicales bacterium]